MPRQSAIRQEVARVLTVAGLPESSQHFERFGKDAHTRVHGSFAVGFVGDQEHTQTRRGQIREINATLAVRLAHRIRAGSAVEDTDTALDAIEDAVIAIEGCDRTSSFHLWPVSRTSSLDGDGTFLLTTCLFAIRFTAIQ